MSAPSSSPVLHRPEADGRGLLHTFLEESARRWPERIAVDIPPGAGRACRHTLTYSELNDMADAVSRSICAHASRDRVVCILLPRPSPFHYASQLAVLKAGAAYTCIDPSFPDERVRSIIEDAEAVAVITDRNGMQRLGESTSFGPLLIDASVAAGDRAQQAERRVPAEAHSRPSDLAYLIYTSGTTGSPKAAMVEHRSIANLVASDLDHLGITPADRVAQGSSASYDSSIEETWFAFASGATLVVLDDETARSGPDLVTWLREERITVFAPPPTQLRALGCRDPEVQLPNVRLVLCGGEELPEDLALRWSRGRELINDYGPTECTVTCLRGRIHDGHTVSIGRPVRGVTAYVLDERLEEAPRNQPGELYIGGQCLARGYWKRPDLTAERFVSHPRHGRLYRTGDLVRHGEDGRFYYLGRLDSQIKLRGYRVELSEIETRLIEQSGVRAAACRAERNGTSNRIVAFIVPEDPRDPPNSAHLRAALLRALPSYMVPTRFGFLEALPTTTSGKLDRAALPALDDGGRDEPLAHDLPRTPLERKLQQAFLHVLRRESPCSIHDDFFDDLGGDSLSTAELVTVLREDPDTDWLTARDVYDHRTVAGLAEVAPDPAGGPMAREGDGFAGDSAPARAPARMALVTAVQTAWLLKNVVLGSASAYLVVFGAFPMAVEAIGLLPLMLVAPLLLVLGIAGYTFLAVLGAASTKKRLIGTYEPVRAPVWGSFYVRNWIVQETTRAIPWWLIEGTEFQNAALRAMGARIGRRVHIHRGVKLLRGGWDLLDIGDDVTLAQDVALGLVEYEAGDIVVDRVAIGSGATLDTHAYVSSGARVGDNAYLTARSSIARGAELPAGESWDGVPARPAGKAPPPATNEGDEPSPWTAAAWMVLARLLLVGGLGAITEGVAVLGARALGVDDTAVESWLTSPVLTPTLLTGWILVSVLPAPVLLVCEALCCRLMGRIRAGSISVRSRAYIRVWLKTGLVASSSNWLYGTMMWPLWLRLAGMKVGRGCEVSTLIDTVPELVEIGDRTFCTDGLYLGGPRLHKGVATLAPTRVGSDCFLGNGALIPNGVTVPDGVLLGVCTRFDPARVRQGTSWFGQPPFELPRRQVITMTPGLTHHPSPARYLVRLFWELLRFGVAGAPALIGLAWVFLLARSETSVSSLVFLFIALPTLSLGLIALNTAFVIGLKWMLLGRAKPGAHPLWSSWACRWDFICMVWAMNVGEIAFALAGTPWLGWLLRAVGVTVGKGVMISPEFAADIATPDMLAFEDGAIVDGLFQDHTFEDRVLKMDRVTIRRGAVLSSNAVLLYGSEVGAGSRVDPNSVVMKNERLPPGEEFVGFPVARLSGQHAS